MWTKQQQSSEPAGSSAGAATAPALAPSRPTITPSLQSASIGSSLKIKGHITGTEDVHIDGKVEGPISLQGHELTVGPNAQLNSEIDAGAVVVYGKIVGNVLARNRVDIKKDGSITGDISTARISIEDGAHFKGRIEIDPAKSSGAI
jgi:cytoskeletal protein CcmA (bactofilin family)